MDSANASITMIGAPADYLIKLLFSYACRSIPFYECYAVAFLYIRANKLARLQQH
jgi:hypothetical protein